MGDLDGQVSWALNPTGHAEENREGLFCFISFYFY